MDDTVLKTSLKKKGVYLFFTKYAVLTGWLICAVALFMADIESDRRIDFQFYVIDLPVLGLVLAICQIGYSWFFPHTVTLFRDRIVGEGPWWIKHVISFHEIRTVLLDENSMIIQKKSRMNKIYIGKSIDPNRHLQQYLLNTLKRYTQIRYVKARLSM